VKSEKAGYVSKCDARIIGEVIRDIGGGRLTKDSTINFEVVWIKSPNLVSAWENLKLFAEFTPPIHANQSRNRSAEDRVEISVKRPAKTPLVVEIISR